MIVVNAIVEASEESIAALRDDIAEMESASRAERGCLDYTFSVELGRPHVVRITEKWESLAALQEHFGQPHMARFRAAMASHPSIGVHASFYETRELESPFS